MLNSRRVQCQLVSTEPKNTSVKPKLTSTIHLRAALNRDWLQHALKYFLKSKPILVEKSLFRTKFLYVCDFRIVLVFSIDGFFGQIPPLTINIWRQLSFFLIHSQRQGKIFPSFHECIYVPHGNCSLWYTNYFQRNLAKPKSQRGRKPSWL